MSLTVIPTAIPEVLILQPEAFGDERGLFFESFNARRFAEATGVTRPFVQDNHSRSVMNVLRGLHFQTRQPQGKLIRVVSGEIFDVAVDIRDSPTYGKWAGALLSAANRHQLWVPEGFAHGFLVTSESAEVLYKTTDYYDPQGGGDCTERSRSRHCTATHGRPDPAPARRAGAAPAGHRDLF